jgi:hypothetical protein
MNGGFFGSLGWDGMGWALSESHAPYGFLELCLKAESPACMGTLWFQAERMPGAESGERGFACGGRGRSVLDFPWESRHVSSFFFFFMSANGKN